MWHVDHLVHDSERQKAKSEKHSCLVSLNLHTTAKSISVWETRTGNLLHNRKKNFFIRPLLKGRDEE